MIKAMLLASLLSSLYADTLMVTGLNYQNDVVTMQTSTGFIYEMYGCEDYQEGDLVSVIFYDNGTENITDDVIIKAQYSGF